MYGRGYNQTPSMASNLFAGSGGYINSCPDYCLTPDLINILFIKCI
jgi:hypothetical protein